METFDLDRAAAHMKDAVLRNCSYQLSDTVAAHILDLIGDACEELSLDDIDVLDNDSTEDDDMKLIVEYIINNFGDNMPSKDVVIAAVEAENEYENALF